MRILTFLLFTFISSCTTRSVPVEVLPEVMTVTEVNPNKWTGITRQNLEQLVHIYDLSPLLFSKKIFIETHATPHSHPDLTLSTRFAEQPHKLLSAFVHEELHWWAEIKNKEMEQAIVEVKKVVPKPPSELTSKGELIIYRHLVICFLEYEAMIHFLNKKEANKILKDFIQKDKVQPWLYTQVYLKFKSLDTIVKKYKLSPLPKSDSRQRKK